MNRVKIVCLVSAVVAILAFGVVNLAPAGAASRPEAGSNTNSLSIHSLGHATISVVGSYQVTQSNGGFGTMTFNSDGTWSVDYTSASYTDTGVWLSDGNIVAATVITPGADSTDLGIMFLGTVTKKGISSAKKQGPYQGSGVSGTWYGIRNA